MRALAENASQTYLEGPLQGGVAGGDGGVVARADVQLVIVLQQQGPLAGVQGGGGFLGQDEVCEGWMRGRKVDDCPTTGAVLTGMRCGVDVPSPPRAPLLVSSLDASDFPMAAAGC